MEKVNQLDWNLTPIDPDPDFDPLHNQKVIDEVLRAGELMAARKQREAEEGAKERTSAISRYVKSIAEGTTKSGVDKFFGTQELTRLRGKEILDRLSFSDLGEKMKRKLKESYKNKLTLKGGEY